MEEETIQQFLESCSETIFDQSQKGKKRRNKLLDVAYSLINQYSIETLESCFLSRKENNGNDLFQEGFFHYCLTLESQDLIRTLLDKGFNPNIFYPIEEFKQSNTYTTTQYYFTPLLFAVYNGFDQYLPLLVSECDLTIYPLNQDQIYTTFIEGATEDHVFNFHSTNAWQSFNRKFEEINKLKRLFGLPKQQQTHYQIINHLMINIQDINVMDQMEQNGFQFNPTQYNEVYLDKKTIRKMLRYSCHNHFNLTNETLEFCQNKGFIHNACIKDKENLIDYLGFLSIYSKQYCKQFCMDNQTFVLNNAKSIKGKLEDIEKVLEIENNKQLTIQQDNASFIQAFIESNNLNCSNVNNKKTKQLGKLL